jgi:hypothetical protein
MTSDELLDGKAGPEAQANEVLRIVTSMIDEAVQRIGNVLPADGNTIAHSGFPFVVVRDKP